MRQRLVRIFLTLTNLTRPAIFRTVPRPLNNTPPLKSMPTIPFFGALFGSKANNKNNMTSYPDERTPDEWRAVLSPGNLSPPTPSQPIITTNPNPP
jgi:peptide-methionine (R)-S-oxide reductase